MLSLAWRALWYRPARTLIALLQALIGALVVALSLALAFAQNRAASRTPDLIQFTAGSRTETNSVFFGMFLPTDLPRLQKLAPDVLKLDLLGTEYIDHLEVGTTSYKLADSRATGPDYAALTHLKMLHGSYFSRRDVEDGAKVVVLSANAARALYGREDAVGERLKIVSGGPGSKATPYRVVGVSEVSDNRQQGVASPLYLPITAVSGFNKASSLIMASKPGRLTQAREQLLSAARATYRSDPQVKGLQARGKSGFFYTSVSDPFGQASSGPNPMLRAYFTIAALTLIVSSLGVLASLLVSVQERTRELGLRRAIGATRGQIVSGLLLETGLTTLLGSVLGVLLATGLVPQLNALFSTTLNGAQLAVPLGLAGTVLGIFVALSLLFGLVPALSSTRMRPTEALRVQG